MAAAHIPTRSIRWHGRSTEGIRQRLEKWLTTAFPQGQDPHPRQWLTIEKTEDWSPETDVHVALQMAHWVERGAELDITDEVVERASRLLPEVCRVQGSEKTRRATEPPHTPSPPSVKTSPPPRKAMLPAIPVNTGRHTAWIEIRAEELRIKKRRRDEAASEEQLE